MHLVKSLSAETQVTAYTLYLTDADLMVIRLRPEDLLLFKECDSEGATISDKLLALETLARRVEEWNKP